MEKAGEITVLLSAWSGGDESTLEALSPLIYDELHRLARRAFAGEKASHTLQPTALVNAAFLKLEPGVLWPRCVSRGRYRHGGALAGGC
jgi:hypothetical protein